MEKMLITTADGSHTLYMPEWEESYHSINGAGQEARHVFIDAGFKNAVRPAPGRSLRVLEMGFGTGLNALLTLQEAEKQQVPVFYEALEKYPLPEQVTGQLNYASLVSEPFAGYYSLIHRAAWEAAQAVSPFFTLRKRAMDVRNGVFEQPFDLIYFDAFASTLQPELWTVEVFKRMYAGLCPQGILVTYSSKGLVKQALREAGFRLERLPGAAGKRHMLRGRKDH